MKNIVYLSTSVKLMTDEQLIDMLTTARKNNAERGVTGVLLYSEGTFLQVLEGDEAGVDEIFGKIETDKRHKNIITLIDDPIDQKSFSDWSMGFNSVRGDTAKNLMGYLASNAKLNVKDANSAAVSTLITFIDSNNLTINY